jgi:RNA polymerase sigma factor (TIGR02999 family)
LGHSADVTDLLLAWGHGDSAALDRLIPFVHEELRRIARRCMGRERRGNSLQPTALVNEAYIRLIDVQRVRWQDRAHFFAMSARLMRRVLIDVARSKASQRRGGGVQRVTFVEGLLSDTEPTPDLIALDDALQALAEADSRKSQVVEMRFFGGLTVEETAEALGVSRDTVIRDWQFSKNWLLREMRRGSHAL